MYGAIRFNKSTSSTLRMVDLQKLFAGIQVLRWLTISDLPAHVKNCFILTLQISTVPIEHSLCFSIMYL